MEHFKKRLIHQCEEYTTVVDTNGKEAGPGEKKEIRVARKKPNCRSKFRHKDLEIYKLGGNTVSTSLCKTREPYNVCKEKKLQEASETGSEAEKTNRSASRGRHALPAVVNPIPERRKSRTVPTKSMEDGNNNTDLCNSLEDTCNPENSSQPPDQPLDSADKPESSVENSSNISPTIVAEGNETATQQVEEQIEEQIEQENPINLCVKKARPEDEVVREVKERPRTLNIPVTTQYPLPMQRNVPTKPSQKIVPISTYQDLPTCTNVPAYQTLETQNQHNTNSLQEDILRSVISLVKDRFLYPFTADSLFILNNWYKYLNQCLIQDKLGPSFRMSVSVLRQTEDFVIENLCLFRCGQSTLPISRKFVQEILKADLNTYKDLLNHLLSRPNSTADWFSRFYDTLKACIQAPNSSRNVLPANSISSNINPSIEKPPYSMPNLNVSMPISQGHCITTSQQPEPCCTRAQSNYCNATSSCASGQRGITTHPHYQRIYVPLDYPVPNTGNYSNGIPSFEPQQMSMVNPSLLQGGHSEYVPLQAQQEMHMAMMKQMSRYPHTASQGMQPPVISNRKNDVQQRSTAFNSVPEPQQARENLRVPLIDIPPSYVAPNFKPGRPRQRRDYVPHDTNQSVISHPIEPHQVTRNRRIFPKQVSVPVSATSQQSLGGLGFVHQPNAQHPMNTGLEQLRINEVHNPRDPRLTSKPGGMAQSAVKSKYSGAKSQEPVPRVRPPATIQQRRVSVISSTEQSRHSTQQTNPNLVVPVLHIPEASSANGWMNSNMPVPGVNQEKRLPMDSGTQQPRHYVPQHVIQRMAVSTTVGVPANAQIQHHDGADGVRSNTRVSGNVITSTTFAGRSNAGSSSKPCTVTSASITEPTKVIVSSSQWTGTAQNAEKLHKEYAPTVPPNINPVPENGTKQLNTTSTTIVGNVIKPVPNKISISSLGTQASSRRVCNGNNLETASDSTSECEGGRGSHGSSTVSAPIITQDIEEVIQTNVIVDPVKTIKRNNVQNALPHIMATNNLFTQLNEDSQLTVLKHNNSKLQMIQTESGSRSKEVTDTVNAVEEREKRNADEVYNAKDLNSSENELRLIKEVLRDQFKDTYPEIVRRVLLAKEEQGKLINGGTDVDREETISVRSDSTSSMSPKRQSEVELDGAAKRVKSEDFYNGNVNVEPDISKSYTKPLKPSLPIIEDISSDEDTATADFATNQKADLQFRVTKVSENITSNQALVHAVKNRQQSLMPNLLPSQLKSGEPTPTITFSLPKTPESPNVPLPEVWQAWLNEERLRGNSFFTPYSTRRQSIETISSVGSDYSPRLNSDDVEIRIDSKWYRVKKHIYDRIPKGKLYYLQQSNRFIRYFDDNQIEQFYRSIGVKTASASDVGHTKPRVESNAETFVIPSDPSQVNELIEVGKEVTFSTEDQLREPEMYVEEIENVRRYVPIDFFGFYQFVTGYQIVRHNYPISFLTFLLLHNTNRIRKLLYDYVTALMQGQCMH